MDTATKAKHPRPGQPGPRPWLTPIGPPPPERQCTHIGTAKGGPDARCEAWAANETTRCRVHGGATVVTQRAGKLRLLMACDIAIEVLVDALQNGDRKDKINAAFGVLDRSGFGPKATVALEDNRHKDLENMSMAELDAEFQRVKGAILEQQHPPIDIEPSGSVM